MPKAPQTTFQSAAEENRLDRDVIPVWFLHAASVGYALALVRAGRVRSLRVIATRTTLTPIMIQAMRWTPWSVTRVWKTMPVMAEAAMEPT
jgi:hypothetical protein